jgi:hypothetical protein
MGCAIRKKIRILLDFLLTSGPGSVHSSPVMRLKTVLALVLFVLGTIATAEAGRRRTTKNPPPACGTSVKLVVSPL